MFSLTMNNSLVASLVNIKKYIWNWSQSEKEQGEDLTEAKVEMGCASHDFWSNQSLMNRPNCVEMLLARSWETFCVFWGQKGAKQKQKQVIRFTSKMRSPVRVWWRRFKIINCLIIIEARILKKKTFCGWWERMFRERKRWTKANENERAMRKKWHISFKMREKIKNFMKKGCVRMPASMCMSIGTWEEKRERTCAWRWKDTDKVSVTAIKRENEWQIVGNKKYKLREKNKWQQT